MNDKNPLRHLPLFAAIFAITPLAVDMYLPAMPTMAEELATTIGQVQWSLSVYLAGYALGMLLFGPLADHYGRRRFLLGGLAGFSLLSLLLSLPMSIEWFIALRFLQAMIGGAATVVIPGSIRDLFGENTAKGLAYVSMTMMIAPMLAPAIGGGILSIGHWSSIFLVLGSYAVVILLWAIRKFPQREFPHREPTSTLFAAVFNNYKTVLTRGSCYPFLFTTLCTATAFFTYITGISFVYITVYDVSEQMFSLFFGLNVGALMLGNLINAKLVSRFGALTLLRVFMLLALLASAGLWLVTMLSDNVYYLVACVLCMMCCLMVVSTNSDAMILMSFPEQSGTATAVIGTLRFGCGALAGLLLALFYDGSAQPFAQIILVSVALITGIQLTLILFSKRKQHLSTL